MAKAFRGYKDIFDDAKQTAIPLIVRRRCTPHQLVVWVALRALLDLRPGSAFGLRDIGAEARLTATPRIQGWIDDLIQLGFLAIEGYEDVPGFQHPRPIYRIPWKELNENNHQEVERYLIQIGQRPTKPPPADPQQLALELPSTVIEGLQLPVIEGSQSTVINGSQMTVIDRSQHCDRSDTDDCDRSITHGWMDRSGMDGSTARPRKRDRPGRPPAIPPPPAGQPALPAHPRDLWRRACANPTPNHEDQLAALAAEHDASTGNSGWYWVGRAILAATIDGEQPRSPALIRNTLIRWRAEGSYGSDRPRRPATKEPTDGRRSPLRLGPRAGRARPQPARATAHQLGGSPTTGPADLSDDDIAAIENAAAAEARLARERGG